MTEAVAPAGTWSLKIYNLLFEQQYYLDEKRIQALVGELILMLFNSESKEKTQFKIAQLFSLMKNKKLHFASEVFDENKEKLEGFNASPDGMLGPAINRLLKALYRDSEVTFKPVANTPPPINVPSIKSIMGQRKRVISHTPQPPMKPNMQ